MLKRGVQKFVQVLHGIDRLLVVTWDEERTLEGGIQAVPVWKLLAGYEPIFR